MKNIVVTGVSSGIGLAIAQKFIENGCRVFGSVRKEADAEAMKKQLGDRFVPLIFDVRDGSAVAAAAQFVRTQVGTEGVFLLVNNAGIVVTGPLQHIDIEEFKKQFEINLFGVQRVTQAFLPLLGATLDPSVPKGKIVNISSVSGIIATPFLGPYCASKVALDFWADSLRRELKVMGVGVVSIQPGPVETPIWEKARQEINLYPNTEYAPLMTMSQKMIDESEKSAIAVARVSKLVWRVAHAGNPKTRYILAGNKLEVLVARLLPHKWLDVLFARLFKKALAKK